MKESKANIPNMADNSEYKTFQLHIIDSLKWFLTK